MPLTTIQSDGWRATYTSPPASFDPVGSPETLSVTRSGFDATGAAASPVDLVTVMARVRLPYPDQASLTAEDVSLSDFIYAGDVISGVTNNSTRAAPKPICMWLDHDLQRTKTGSYTAKLAVAHAHARNGRPVAAVKFIATDGTTTVEQTVSTMTSTVYAASGLTVAHFEATLDFSTLTDNAMITIDAVICPWVGEAYQASVDGAAYPSINFTTMRVLNDVSYGTAYAYVDPVSGNNGTGVVSQTPATAEASPYATIAAAATAIQTYNNANFGRNNASGGIIRLVAGTHVHSTYSSVAVGDIPLEIEAANPAATTATIYKNPNDSHTIDSIPDRLKIKSVNLQRSQFNRIFLDSAAGLKSDHVLVFEDCEISGDATSVYTAWVWQPGRFWLINTTDTGGGEGVTKLNSSTRAKSCNVIGCDGAFAETLTYNMAGSNCDKAALINTSFGVGNQEPANGIFIGYSFLTNDSASQPVLNWSGYEIGPEGSALVQSILEKTSGGSATLVSIHADANTQPAQNIVVQGVTAVGQRTNILYNDSGAELKLGHIRNSIFDEWNSKSDVFASNGTYNGNWSVIHHVSDANNAYLRGSSQDDSFGVGSWLGEVTSLNDLTGTDASPISADFADDASTNGSGLGGGDYTPGALTELQFVPAGHAVYPMDLYGRAIPDDGTAFVGARQQEVSGTTIPRGTSIAAGATFTASGNVARARSAAMSAASSVTASASRTIHRAVSVAAQTSVTATAASALGRAASISATSGVTAQASVTRYRTASVAGQGVVAATGALTIRRTVAIAAVSSLSASTSGVTARAVSIEATSGVSVVARLTKRRAAGVTATSTAQAVAGRVLSRTVHVEAAGTLTAVSLRTLTRGASIAANSTVSAITVGASRVALFRDTAIWDEPLLTAIWDEPRFIALWRQ